MPSNNIKLVSASHQFLDILEVEKNSLPNDHYNLKNIGFLSDYFKYLLLINDLNPQKILDWGAGNGHISYLLKYGLNLNVDSFLVNPDLKTKIFLEKLKLNVVTTRNNFDLPYKSNEYDIVISSGVLEHVNEYGGDLDYSLKEIIRVLSPGGYIVVWRLPFAFSIWEYFRYSLRHWYHPERYTPLQIKHLAKKYNLSVIDIGLDGVFFVSLRCYLRKFNISNRFINFLEIRINKIPLLHFLLNDIYCILKKN